MANTTERAIAGVAMPGARWSPSRVQVGGAFVGLASFTIAVFALQGEPNGAVAAPLLLGAILPLGFGIARLARVRNDRFALALIGTGGVWSLTTLASANGSVAYSIGRVAVWVLEPLTVALILAYPHGRIESRS